MLSILDLFGPDRPVWKADELAAASGCSVATAYRYLAELCRAGLLGRVNGDYTLGAYNNPQWDDAVLHTADGKEMHLSDPDAPAKP